MKESQFKETLQMLLVNAFFLGIAGLAASRLPDFSSFWWTIVKAVVVLSSIGAIIGGITKLFINELNSFKYKLINFNIMFLFILVLSWRVANEPIFYGVFLVGGYITCIYVGIKYRDFIQKESFNPKTKLGKSLAFIGVIGPVGGGFLGFVLGQSSGGSLLIGYAIPFWVFLMLLLANSTMRQIENRVERRKNRKR